ncbi:MAG: DUF1080 domain-containing protein [Planctomycetaceae bacterium]|jgi:hypothetical protein|nr:DUF1080 domain-containing protein [Planctomycetaceae bacterium]
MGIRIIIFFGSVLLLLASIIIFSFDNKPARVNVHSARVPITPVKVDNDDWQPLFNGKDLDGWSIVPEPDTALSREVDAEKEKAQKTDPKNANSTKIAETKTTAKRADVRFEGGAVVVDSVDDMRGLRYTREFPKQNYEICYEAKRTAGSDFFAAITFPVEEECCTFVNGGWGGTTIGLSRVDDFDASENETFDSYSFNDNEWYKFRINVTKNKIAVWITGKDGNKESEEKQVVDLDLKDKKISLREETEPYRPLGFAAYYSNGEIKNAKYRKIEKD